jgi:hypothetical protein
MSAVTACRQQKGQGYRPERICFPGGVALAADQGSIRRGRRSAQADGGHRRVDRPVAELPEYRALKRRDEATARMTRGVSEQSRQHSQPSRHSDLELQDGALPPPHPPTHGRVLDCFRDVTPTKKASIGSTCRTAPSQSPPAGKIPSNTTLPGPRAGEHAAMRDVRECVRESRRRWPWVLRGGSCPQRGGCRRPSAGRGAGC